MKSEERINQFGSPNHYGPIAARPALPAPLFKSRSCGELAGTNRKRRLDHQKKLASAIVRLCAAGASSRKTDRGGFNYQIGAE
jgi:hypothetical protein